MPTINKRLLYILICCLLILITLVVYWQTVQFEFVDFDDKTYVYQNPYVQMGLSRVGLHWAATAVYQCTWQPLVWISYMVDSEMQGPDPGGYHLTNVLLHILNVLLLFVLLARLTALPWRSALVAALFAVHPLHVESVAWVAERKDVLSTLFWLLATLAYVEYTRHPRNERFAAVCVFLALGLMAKPMLVTLPFTLLMLDYWPLGRIASSDIGKGNQWGALIRDKVPLFFLVGVFSVVTFLVQRSGGSVSSLERLPIAYRPPNAVFSYVAYLVKTVWPARLGVIYPHPGPTLPIWEVLGAGALLIAATLLAIRYRRRCPYVLFGWVWYLVTLAPVIGIVQIGPHGMADRFTYVPLIGVFIAVVWGVCDLMKQWIRQDLVRKAVLGVAGAGVIAALTVCAHIQTSYWQDTTTLFEHTVKVTRNNAFAHRVLGGALATEGRVPEAIPHFREALRISPDYLDARCGLGMALETSGHLDEAITQYSLALKMAPNSSAAHLDLGAALAQKDEIDQAIKHFKEAIRLNPTYAGAHFNLAAMYYEKGRYEEAWSEVHLCERLGGAPNPAFVETLAAKMPDPGS